MERTNQGWAALVALCLVLLVSAPATIFAAGPTAAQALLLKPIQSDVEYDTPTGNEVEQCTFEPVREGKQVGWVLRNAHGLMLRRFMDSNGDNVVDQWSYYKDGLEVYRDIDSNYNGRADQYRWFHTGGTRWGLDTNEDGTIDSWKVLSAEEASAEVVRALATRDAARFARVALSAEQAKALGLGEKRTAELLDRVSKLLDQFRKLAAEQRVVSAQTQWVQFGATQPGVVPAGTDGSTRDLRVYENVVAIVETGPQPGQVQIGTLVQVGDVWRTIDVPNPVAEGQTELVAGGFFFRTPAPQQSVPQAGATSEKVQELLAEMEKLDQAAAQATTPAQQVALNARRADLLEQIAASAESAEQRGMWLRQLADTVSAAVQSGEYPEGAQRLAQLFEKVRAQDTQLAAYVRFRELLAENGLALQDPKADFVKIQAEWLKNLEQFIKDYPDSADAAEAMLQLAMSQEFAGQEDEARQWYTRLLKSFPESSASVKATGALRRLDSVGKAVSLRGAGSNGEMVDLAEYRGKVVLIQYWASWCEPCKADMAAMRDILSRYARLGFAIIGVNLDNSRQAMQAFLAEHQVPWPQLFEEGGLDSRPANEMGILTLPTMILVDQAGRVVNRNIHVAELEGELKKLLR